jgi:hypothetical protein
MFSSWASVDLSYPKYEFVLLNLFDITFNQYFFPFIQINSTIFVQFHIFLLSAA